MKLSDDLQVEKKTDWLSGLDMALGVSSGVAASQSVKLVRELRRHGAEVTVYLTPGAKNFVGPTALEWASGKPLQNEFSANALHIFQHELFLIAPATLNVISEISAGIASNVVTTMAQSLLGMLALEGNEHNTACCRFLLAPTMHSSMAANPILKAHLNKLKLLGVDCVPAKMEEGKAKLPNVEDVLDYVVRAYNSIKFTSLHVKKNFSKESRSVVNNKNFAPPAKFAATSLKKVRVLVTAGGSYEKIDGVRVLSNLASGRTGVHLARRAFHYGATVFLLASSKLENVPNHLNPVFFEDSADYSLKCLQIIEKKKCSTGVFSAAISDFTLKKGSSDGIGKLDSKTPQQLELLPQEKTIEKIHKTFPLFSIVAFKLHPMYGIKNGSADHRTMETGEMREMASGVKKAVAAMLQSTCVAVVANGLQSLKGNAAAADRSLCLRDGKTFHLQSLDELAETLFKAVSTKKNFADWG